MRKRPFSYRELLLHARNFAAAMAHLHSHLHPGAEPYYSPPLPFPRTFSLLVELRLRNFRLSSSHPRCSLIQT